MILLYTSVGTKFYYYNGAVATLIPGMMTKPVMPGLPQRVAGTSQDNDIEQFAAGIRQLGEPTFQFKHEVVDAVHNYETFKALEGTLAHFGVSYPDGKAIEFYARPYVQRDGTGVSVLDTFTVSMFNEGAFTEVAAPTLSTGTLGVLMVTSVAGSTSGKSVITVAPEVTSGILMYKTQSGSAPTCTYDQDLSSGWTPIVSGTEITATTGYYITVAMVNSQLKARSKGSTVIASL